MRITLTMLLVVLSPEIMAQSTYPDVVAVGAMKHVKWKGELQGVVRLDTLEEKTGLYGLGPQSYLIGELLIYDGITYLSQVTSDSTMKVVQTSEVEAPFFVYGNVREWKTIALPSSVKDIKSLEQYIDSQTKEYKRPFVFKLSGTIPSAQIHIQNLPLGTKVSSPKDAHKGQIQYLLEGEDVEIVGFFSTKHQGIFTHHDTYLHMHLITKDKQQMGHVDWLNLSGEMQLLLPVK
ncbi:MAG: acetolactate decarboxylase [Bacteroidota bacterium]